MPARELEQALHLGLLVFARVVPLFVLTPYLAWGAASFGFALALGLGCACVVTPLCWAASATSVSGSWALTIASELVRGVIVALGIGLPFTSLRMAGGIAGSLLGVSNDPAATSGRLARLCALAAVAIAVGHSGLCGALRMLLDTDTLPPLGTDLTAVESVRASCLALARLSVEATALGVSLSGPILLGQLSIFWVAGALGRLAPRASSHTLGPAVLPWLGLALVTLALANWFDAVPELVRRFAQSTARLLASLP